MAVSHRASFSLVVGAAAACRCCCCCCCCCVSFFLRCTARRTERTLPARYWLPRYARGIAASNDNIKLVVLAVAALRWRRDSRIYTERIAHTGERRRRNERNATTTRWRATTRNTNERDDDDEEEDRRVQRRETKTSVHVRACACVYVCLSELAIAQAKHTRTRARRQAGRHARTQERTIGQKIIAERLAVARVGRTNQRTATRTRREVKRKWREREKKIPSFLLSFFLSFFLSLFFPCNLERGERRRVNTSLGEESLGEREERSGGAVPE